MKKLVAVICLVFFVGAFANAQTTSTDNKEKSEKVVKCTEAEKANCEKSAAKSGAKCETTDAKSSAGCSSSAKAGSCCKSGSASNGSTSAGSCCSKGKGDKAEAAPSEMKKSKSSKSTAQVAPAKK